MDIEKDWTEYKRDSKLDKIDDNSLRLIEKLALIGCTEEEIGFILGVAPRVFTAWKNNPEDTRIIEALERGKTFGKLSLRHAQYQIALPNLDEGYHGNPKMLIHLGKHVLGQTDELKIGGNGKDPVAIKLIWGDLPPELKPEVINNNDENENEDEDDNNEI